MLAQNTEIKANGFRIFRADKVKRLTPTHFLVKTQTGVGSYLVEIHDGKWSCECDQEDCEHRYAAQLASATIRPIPNDNGEQALKCRYCGSPDLARCGFRYNAYGISHRYRCNECLRKFSVKYSDSPSVGRVPSEMTWLLAEIGMLLTKIENLIEKASLELMGNADGQ